MASSSASKDRPGDGEKASKPSREQKDAEDYLSRYKLREIFQGLLRHIIEHQPDDPIAYFHEEISKIRKEVEEDNIDVASTTFLTNLTLPHRNNRQ